MGRWLSAVVVGVALVAAPQAASGDSEVYRQADTPPLSLKEARSVAERLVRVRAHTTGARRAGIGECGRTSPRRVLCRAWFVNGTDTPVAGGPFERFDTLFVIHKRSAEMTTNPRFAHDPWWD